LGKFAEIPEKEKLPSRKKYPEKYSHRIDTSILRKNTGLFRDDESGEGHLRCYPREKKNQRKTSSTKGESSGINPKRAYPQETKRSQKDIRRSKNYPIARDLKEYSKDITLKSDRTLLELTPLDAHETARPRGHPGEKLSEAN